MRLEETRRPSFPSVNPNVLLDIRSGERWQVACGDEGHWRVGYYSPSTTRPDDLTELERHDCPELFMLVSGRLGLLLVENGATRELMLEAGRPTLVTAPHAGFCPDGPHTGVAIVVERDAFDTEYRSVADWIRQG